MHIVVVGLGLIGGSLAKAAIRAGHSVAGVDPRPPEEPWCSASCAPQTLADADLVLMAVPPAAVVPWVEEHAPFLKQDAVVVDATGVKSGICKALEKYAFQSHWTFVGGHPMAGKEVSGFANSSADLFRGASMILTPYPSCGRSPLDMLEAFFRSLGFDRVIVTTPEHHDRMIALTSQLAHVVSSAYVQAPEALEHRGYSAGSFHDMTRVALLDPDIWRDLLRSNGPALLDALDGLIARLGEYRRAIATDDNGAALRDLLAAGRAARMATLGS
jgi:prephenate dehydrogenase